MHISLPADRLFVTVDLMILSEREGRLQLMLGRRTGEPFAGRWALPGRFVGMDESAEEAAQLLLAEMLPVPTAYTEQLFTFTQARRDPRGRVISVAYLTIVPWQCLAQVLEGGGSPLRCFTPTWREDVLTLESEGETLQGGDLAFDHEKIIATGLNRLQGKIDYTDIGFRFLATPEAFSLGEMQRIFEAVLQKPLDASNFRRFMLGRWEGRIEQTELMEKNRRGRPAALYRWKP